MSIEIIQITLPCKGSNVSQADYKRGLQDGRTASSASQKAAFDAFEIRAERSSNAKGKDGVDSSGGPVEHKMLVTYIYFRPSSFTGVGRMCLPDDVISGCEKSYVISCSDVNLPFAVLITKDTVQEWLKEGYIDPVTGAIKKNTFLALIRSYDKDRILPTGEDDWASIRKAAAKRLEPDRIAQRVKGKVDGFEERSKERIADGRMQQERYERLRNSK